MNAISTSEREPLALVDIVQFKWLMTHAGQHIHVERMQADAAYADKTLSWAEASGDATLQKAAGRLRAVLASAG